MAEGNAMLYKPMTVYEALQEVKLLESKIDTMVHNMVPNMFLPAVITSDKVDNGDKKEDIKAVAKVWYDKYCSYTNRLNLLRSLIYESNIKTTMTVGSIRYSSVAAAITRYKNIQKEIDFWVSLQKDYLKKQGEVTRANQKNLDPVAIAKNINPNGLEYSPEQLEQLSKSYKESVEREVYDALELTKNNFLSEKVDEIVEFREKFHTELNKLNLQTIIEVPIDEPVM